MTDAFDWRNAPRNRKRSNGEVAKLLARIVELDRSGKTHHTARTLGLKPAYLHQLRRRIAGLPRR